MLKYYIGKGNITVVLKEIICTLAGVAQWIEHQPVN